MDTLVAAYVRAYDEDDVERAVSLFTRALRFLSLG